MIGLVNGRRRIGLLWRATDRERKPTKWPRPGHSLGTPRGLANDPGLHMNKAQVVARVARETGLTRADVLRVLDAFLDTVVRALRKGEPVKLVDFGTFLVTRRRSRPGHNPHTGQPMRITGRRWPRFSAGKGLRQAVAERRPRPGTPAAEAGALAASAAAFFASAPPVFSSSSALSRARSGRGASAGRSSSSSVRSSTGTVGLRPSPWIATPFGETYFAVVSEEAPLGQRHRLRHAGAAERVLADELRAVGLGERGRHDLAGARGAVADERDERAGPRLPRGVRLQQLLGLAPADELRHRPAVQEDLGHLRSLGRGAPRGGAQVEHEASSPRPSSAPPPASAGPPPSRRELGDLARSRSPSPSSLPVGADAHDPLAHERDVERVGAGAQDPELHRRAGRAAQQPLGHDRRHLPRVPLVDRLHDVARRAGRPSPRASPAAARRPSRTRSGG